MRRCTFVLALVVGAVGIQSADARILKREPAPGALASGSTVLVDDGTCGKGKIKKVSGGSNMREGRIAAGGSPRTRSCVPR